MERDVLCTRKQCKRTFAVEKLYCKCGAWFCSEHCFVNEWTNGHKNSCPDAAAIEAAQAANRTGRAGTAALVAAALSRKPPPPKAKPEEPEAPESDQTVGQQEALQGEAAQEERVGRGPVGEPDATMKLDAVRRAKDAPLDATVHLQVARRAPPPPAPDHAQQCGDAPTKSTASSSKPSYKLKDFVIEGNPLGNGSYGVVQKVRHKGTQELFAMKVIPKQKVKEHKMTEYLFREVSIQIRLRHPNILRLHYYFEDGDKVYLLLEYANAGSLFSFLRKRGHLSEREAGPIYLDVARGLQHLHENDIIHRDLKPENILMCEGMVAKLADFGWCAEIKSGAPRNTFCGTMDYLSPEMVQSKPHDHSVDIWSLGVLLFEMLVGKAPFTDANQVKALTLIAKVDLKLPDFLSEQAGDLIRKLVVREPERRLDLQSAMDHQWVLLNSPTSGGVARPAPALLDQPHKQETSLSAGLDATRIIPPSAVKPPAEPVAPAPAPPAPVPPAPAPALLPVPVPAAPPLAPPPALTTAETGCGFEALLGDSPEILSPGKVPDRIARGLLDMSLPVEGPLRVDGQLQNEERRQNSKIATMGLGAEVVAGTGPGAPPPSTFGHNTVGALAPPLAAGFESRCGVAHGNVTSTPNRRTAWTLHEPELVTPPQVQREPSCRSRSVSPGPARDAKPPLGCLLEEDESDLKLFKPISPVLTSTFPAIGTNSTPLSKAGGALQLSQSIRRWYDKNVSTPRHNNGDFMRPQLSTPRSVQLSEEVSIHEPGGCWRTPSDVMQPSPRFGGSRSKSCAAKYHQSASGEDWNVEDQPSMGIECLDTNDKLALWGAKPAALMTSTSVGKIKALECVGYEMLPLQSARSAVSDFQVDANPRWIARPKRRAERRASTGSRELPTVQLEY